MLSSIKRIVVFLFLVKSTFAFAQGPEQAPRFACGSDTLHKQKLAKDLPYRQRMLLANHAAFLAANKRSNAKIEASVYTVPVVVHIIHSNGSENISDQQVLDAIVHLNKAFGNQAPYRGPNSVDVGIQFCLAQQDPDGNFTTGINRLVSPLTNLNQLTDDVNVKNLIRWDPTQYLNIWLVNEICVGASNCGVAAYSTLAPSHGFSNDGVVCEARWFGSTEDNSKIPVHELGHYFNLLHTFEGDCSNTNCMTDGDMVCDTPPDASTANVEPCTAIANSCTTDNDDHSPNNPFRPVALGGKGDQVDMVENHMDYGLPACHTTFTAGQKVRMVSALTGIRASLLSSKGCATICTQKIVASFTTPAGAVNVGDVVNFTNTSTGATDYTWKVDGVPFSTATDATRQFTITGNHTITLVAKNSDIACTKEQTQTLQAVCVAKASFTSTVTTINTGDAVVFTNTSLGAISYKWVLDGTVVATSTDLTQAFPIGGGYTMYLVASTDVCSDTSAAVIIKVGSCTRSKNTNTTWYFGRNSGFDFKTVPPTKITNSNMMASEGCSGICDSNGDILFYSDGGKVYNRNHLIMPNGLGLLGSNSSTQSCLITPYPGSTTKYFVFTTDAYEGAGLNGLRYSIVDMSLNGGLGDVVVKNVGMFGPCSEKLTGCYHSNSKDIWIVTQKYDGTYAAFLVTSSGVSLVPVISNTGAIFGGLGAMKLSSNGKKLAVLERGDKIGIAYLYDFNATTGEVSNQQTLLNDANISNYYGLEFSPNFSKLYITSLNASATNLFQFDINAGSNSAIINSKVAVNGPGTLYSSGIALGPDNKLYVNTRYVITSYLNSIAVINNPDLSGAACDFVDNAYFFDMFDYSWSMPNLLRNKEYFNLIGPDSVCANATKVNYISSGNSVVEWTALGNLLVEEKTKATLSLSFTHPGTARIYADAGADGCVLSDTIDVVVLPRPLVNVGVDTTYCYSSFNRVLSAGSATNTYRWNDLSTLPTKTVTSPGTYSVEVTNEYGCVGKDTIRIKTGKPPVASLADAEICEGELHQFTAEPGYTYVWQDGTTSKNYNATFEGIYWVRINDVDCGTSSDTAYLTVKPVPVVGFSGLPSSLCKEDTLVELTGSPTGGVFSGPGVVKNYFNTEMLEEGIYGIRYTYSASNGCVVKTTQQLTIKDTCALNLFIPNLITINGDQMNDRFEISGLPKDSHLDIFNRWGDRIYSDTNYANSWNAENSEAGVYYYVLTVKKNKVFKGWLQVVK